VSTEPDAPGPGGGNPELALRDPSYVARWLPFIRLAVKGWHRSEVHGIEQIPDGGALLVSNHSGGITTMDVPVLALAFFDHFGIERPLYVLTHDLMLMGPMGVLMRKAGLVAASRRNASDILRSGGVTVVFPGGDHDAYRPTSQSAVIDFDGRTGYVRSALEVGVPIVPVVSIGGQENQLYVARGERIAKRFGLQQRVRSKYWPVSVGFPFGVSMVFPPNLPFPTKIVTRVLEPIDLPAEFGADPDVDAVDREVRARMQAALSELAKGRRFPVLG
jgi:1-acyl-sn-glycerol-3-phosphate acyltransferase